jgi:SAM-dependent methyltransferase
MTLDMYRQMVRDEWMIPATTDAWRSWHPKMEQQMVNVQRALLERARLAPGLRVLDLACGPGDTALTIARTVGPTGHVTASDLSPVMVATCRENATRAGMTNMDFAVADAESLPFPDASFDRITSRLGIMYFVDVQRALAQMKRVLRQNGALSVLVWGPAEESPYFVCGLGPFLRRLAPPAPPPDAPGPLRFAAPGVLHDELVRAGFNDVHEEKRSVVLPWPGPAAELFQHLYDVAIPARPLFDGLGPSEREQAIDEAVAGYRRYDDGTHVNVPASIIVCSATA